MRFIFEHETHLLIDCFERDVQALQVQQEPLYLDLLAIAWESCAMDRLNLRLKSLAQQTLLHLRLNRKQRKPVSDMLIPLPQPETYGPSWSIDRHRVTKGNPLCRLQAAARDEEMRQFVAAEASKWEDGVGCLRCPLIQLTRPPLF